VRRTWALEIGRCGWGVSGGLVPELRLGWVRFWTCSGSVVNTIATLRQALADAAEELRRRK
jgi:hypothetical protein